MYARRVEGTTGERRARSEEQRDRRHLTGRRSQRCSSGSSCSCR